MCRRFDLERAGAEDLPAIMSLVAAANWPHRIEDVTAAFHLGRAWRAVAFSDGGLLGIAMWWPFDAQAARVGLVVVAPEAQGSGIGRALMQRVMEDAAPRSLMLLATEEGRPLYDKLGFETVGRSRRHQGLYRHEPIADRRIGSARNEDLPAILSIDRAALGAGRPDVLNHLTSVGDVVVLRAREQVTGYAVARPFGKGSVVGPIVAANEEDAIDLFRAVARPGVLRVDRPADAPSFGQILNASGLRGEEICDEMVWGEWPRPSGPTRSFAMASHA